MIKYIRVLFPPTVGDLLETLQVKDIVFMMIIALIAITIIMVKSRLILARDHLL